MLEAADTVEQFGSSPRARGTQPAEVAPRPARRIIPACAGNTRARRSATRPSADHPRVRGEHTGGPGGQGASHGSSPRARGTRDVGKRQRIAVRIIPACAGNTYCIWVSFRMRTDHPRVRGEHYDWRTKDIWTYGSSPRARGTPDGDAHPRLGGRIIPACAGNTDIVASAIMTATDHPRVRGEHTFGSASYARRIGSSPRARGTLRQSWPRHL